MSASIKLGVLSLLTTTALMTGSANAAVPNPNGVRAAIDALSMIDNVGAAAVTVGTMMVGKGLGGTGVVTLGVEALAGAAAMAGGTGDGTDQASTGAAVDGLARVVVDTGEAHAVVE